MLIHTERAAVAIGEVRAYPNGFEFTVYARLRYDDDDDAGPLGGRGPFDRFGRRVRDPGDHLRLGIMYADGRRAAATGYRPPPGAAGELFLQENGGGGSSRAWDGKFWVHPLPPDGPVTFVASWPEHGVAETRAELDGTAIIEAARRAVILWPEEPEAEPGDAYAWSSQTVVAGKPDDPGAKAETDSPGPEAAGSGG